MNCLEAESHVSVLYDGELAPIEAARHIEQCATCRDRLRTYSQMGAEIRLLASLTAPVSVVSPELLRKMRSKRPSKLDFLWERVSMPRFAVAACVVAMLAAIPATWTIVRAQSKPLWFQFELGPKSTKTGHAITHAAKAGYDDQMAWMYVADGQDLTAGLSRVGAHVAVKSIEDGKVQFEIVARNFGSGDRMPTPSIQKEVANLKMQTFTYIPGQNLEIPIDGGGTLILHGKVVDHQPKIAWGFPLEPDPGQLFVRSPVLTEGDRLVADLQGGTAVADDESQTVALHGPVAGPFIFGLRKFPGAVKGKANWGQLTFKIEGKSYTLTAGSPICGGEQPCTVWVALDSSPPLGHRKGAWIGGGPAQPK